MSALTAVEILDAMGVLLAVGQRVVYHTMGHLQLGTVVALRKRVKERRLPDRVRIRRDADNRVITMSRPMRVMALRDWQDPEQ